MVQLVAPVASMHLLRSVVAGLALLGLSLAPGCGDLGSDEPVLDCSEQGPAEIMLAHGVPPFVPLADGDALPIAFGLQGGFHVLLCVSSTGLAPGSPTLAAGIANDDLPRILWTLTGADGDLSSESPRRTVAAPEASDTTTLALGWTRFESQLVVLRYFVEPPADFDADERETELEAESFTLTATIEDACGRRISASRTVRVAFP